MAQNGVLIFKRSNFEYYVDESEHKYRYSLGSGTFGAVYRGHLKFSNTHIGEELVDKTAVKIHTRNKDKKANKENYKVFQNEARFLVSFAMDDTKENDFYPSDNTHPNIVRLYATHIVGAESNDNFLVVELLDIDIESYTHKRHDHDRRNDRMRGSFHDFSVAIKEEMVITIMKGILSGLYFMHGNGFVHADLKNQNVLLGLVKDDGPNKYRVDKVKIADFGLSLDYPELATANPGYLVTMSYRPIELLLKEVALYGVEDQPVMRGVDIEITSQIDIYSLGIMLYQLMHRMIQPEDSIIFDNKFYPVMVRGEDAPSLWIFAMFSRFGNMMNYPPNLSWPLGIEVYKAVQQRHRFLLLQNYSPYKTRYDFWERDFQRQVNVAWIDLFLSLTQYNPDIRLTAHEAYHSDLLKNGITRLPDPENIRPPNEQQQQQQQQPQTQLATSASSGSLSYSPVSPQNASVVNAAPQPQILVNPVPAVSNANVFSQMDADEQLLYADEEFE